ncbi:MAG TPA: helix-turn-helix domain-containing protein [Nocardioides sp.]
MTDRGAATRARLIAATIEVVRDVGYAHASTRAIAAVAGVAEGTIYRHFPDKASLFLTAALSGQEEVIDWVERLPERAGQGSVVDELTDSLMRLAQLRDAILPLELALLTDPDLARRRHAAILEGPDDPPGPPQAIARYLAEEQASGRVRSEVEPRTMAVVLMAALFGLALMSAETETVDRGLVEAAVRLIVAPSAG